MKPFKRFVFIMLSLLFMGIGLVFSPYGYDNLSTLGGMFFGVGLVMFFIGVMIPTIEATYKWFTS